MHGPATRIISPIYFGKVAEKKSDLLAAVLQVRAELERFERELANSAWFGGEAVGAANIAIYPFIKSLLRAAAKDEAPPLNLGLLPLEERFPELAAWMQKFERTPGYERTYPPHWRQ
jgi:glutathione S-transferase